LGKTIAAQKRHNKKTRGEQSSVFKEKKKPGQTAKPQKESCQQLTSNKIQDEIKRRRGKGKRRGCDPTKFWANTKPRPQSGNGCEPSNTVIGCLERPKKIKKG